MQKIKFNLLLSFLVATIGPCIAQDVSGSYIGISGGYALPSGNFAKSDYLDLKAGFAQSGPLLSLDGAYFFKNHIGVGAVVSLANFGIKDKETLAAGYVEAFAVDEVTMTVGSYKMLNVLPAVYYTLPLNKLNVDFRVMAGYTSLTMPEIKVQLEDAADTPLIQKKSTGSGLGLGVGAGLRYQLVSHLGLALRLDYLYTKPSIDVTYENLNNPTDSFRLLTKYDESIGILNASLGLIYAF